MTLCPLPYGAAQHATSRTGRQKNKQTPEFCAHLNPALGKGGVDDFGNLFHGSQ